MHARHVQIKDWQYFECVPAEGVMEPGARTQLKVIFTPVLHRDAPYAQGIPIKINLNPKSKEISASGRGMTPKVTFSPAYVDCGAILPFFEGQVSELRGVQCSAVGVGPGTDTHA